MKTIHNRISCKMQYISKYGKLAFYWELVYKMTALMALTDLHFELSLQKDSWDKIFEARKQSGIKATAEPPSRAEQSRALYNVFIFF